MSAKHAVSDENAAYVMTIAESSPVFFTGLRYGSVIYFLLGRQIVQRERNGQRATVELVIHSDDWTLENKFGTCVLDSGIVNRSLYEEFVAPLFCSATLTGLYLKTGKLLLDFSNSYRFVVEAIEKDFDPAVTISIFDGPLVGAFPLTGLILSLDT